MKTTFEEFEKVAELIRDSDIYQVYDMRLEHLTLSKTKLYPGKNTTGHFHDTEEEVYIFIQGSGEMRLDKDMINVSSGDIVTIKPKAFHQVFNTGDKNLVFFAIFEKYEREDYKKKV